MNDNQLSSSMVSNATLEMYSIERDGGAYDDDDIDDEGDRKRC